MHHNGFGFPAALLSRHPAMPRQPLRSLLTLPALIALPLAGVPLVMAQTAPEVGGGSPTALPAPPPPLPTSLPAPPTPAAQAAPVTTATAGTPEQPTAAPDVLEGIVVSGDAPPTERPPATG
jgi:hypothetical protein